MTSLEMRVEDRRFLRGCSAGLIEKTALVDLSVNGVFSNDPMTDLRIRAGAMALNPAEPLHGIANWPADFLISQDEAESDRDLYWLGGWVIALTVAIQRWGHSPVWRGRVCGGEPGRLTLAIPWSGRQFFDDALALALRLVTDWVRSVPCGANTGLQPTLDSLLDGQLPVLRSRGLGPVSLRFVEAAVRRGMPFEVHPSFVQIGWGANAERVDMALTGRTGWIGVAMALNKDKASQTLAGAAVPIPYEPFDGIDYRLLVVRGAVVQSVRVGVDSTEDVTAIVHPDNVALATRSARIVGLDIAGIDLCCPDISRSWHDVGAVVRDINGQPDFHAFWQADPERDINGEVLDLLFAGRSSRIPTAAIAGTNGKTTTSEMLARIWTVAGKVTGVCTTERVRIGDQIISTDNLSGQPGARIILNDPAVQAAVVEMPRKGLIIFGHQCDRYDVAAMLNVQDDHIGLDGIETFEQMAELKAEVLQRASGAIVVNAEDPLCLAMRDRAGTDRHILVARTPVVDAVVEHRRQGGEAVFIDNRHGLPWIVLAAGASDVELMPVHDIPATMNGLLALNAVNALFAAALAWAQGVDTAVIRVGLSSFRNSADENPGRYNFIDGLPFQVLLDFAHNPDGVRGICAVVAGLPVSGRRLLCNLNIGSRDPSHFDTVAQLMAASFDYFVLGCDHAEVRGCSDYGGDDPPAAMVARSRTVLLAQGVNSDRIIAETDPLTAIRAVFDRAHPGDLVVLLATFEEARPVLAEWGVPAEKGHPPDARNWNVSLGR